ncbi:MAG TPA: PIG-L family deacetylase [Rubrivivax sp.]|nr:PIG-L family deacetylase [Rubrivivax sp.]
MLVLAPHPDDEVLGCGGSIAASLSQGAFVDVIVASDGGLGGDPRTREAESTAAARVLSAAGDGRLQLSFWRLPDRTLAGHPELGSRIADRLANTKAELLLLPSPLEIHPDHRGLCLAGIEAARTLDWEGELLFYEVGHPLLADRLVDITRWIALKRDAIDCFASQLAVQAYGEQLLGLNRYRAYTLGPAVSHAEAFQSVARQSWRDGLEGVWTELAPRLRARYPAPSAGP